MNLSSPPNGAHPQEIPNRWRFENGIVRTDLQSLSNAELQSLGWIGPIIHPQPFTENDESIIEGDYDPETHKVVWYRALRQYVIVEKHIDEIPFDSVELVPDSGNIPGVPDWNTFKQTAVSSVSLNLFIGSLMSIAPVAATALPATLLLLQGGTYTDFANTWGAIKTLTNIPEELIQEFVLLAESCNLPNEFVDIFSS